MRAGVLVCHAKGRVYWICSWIWQLIAGHSLHSALAGIERAKLAFSPMRAPHARARMQREFLLYALVLYHRDDPAVFKAIGLMPPELEVPDGPNAPASIRR